MACISLFSFDVFEGFPIVDERHVMVPTLVLEGVTPLSFALFCVSDLLLHVIFFSFYAVIISCHNIFHGVYMLLGKRLIKMPDF